MQHKSWVKRNPFISLLFVSILIFAGCSSDSEEDLRPEVDPETITIWTGAPLTFTKTDNADPTQESNQDRITDNVWLTRGNSGGQIFNAAVESSSAKNSSPEGTLWALGTTDEIENLTFSTFREVVRTQSNRILDNLDTDFVLHLVEDDIYLDIRFTSWTSGKTNGGGFTYVRSTEN